MADIEAIREARRRRILQASEIRINRVLGQPADENEELVIYPKRTARPEHPKNHGENTEFNSTQEDRNTAADSLDKEKHRSTVKITPIKRNVSTQNTSVSQNDSLNTSRSSSDAKMILKHFEFLRIVLSVMVAYLCRRVLSTGYGVFYFQSIIIPFALMEAGFFMFKHKVLHNVTLPHKSSMLIGVLMLCGIKPEVVHLYNQIMGYLTAASEDFAMFFFAFLMANIFIA
ncbi:uncharacterized protein LOC127866041 [Dreissena polymorpha]|uniref:Calcium signal-modulating cyclophilin ligand n=1 Tax=Dreissena polymorpha TaxID=45954 RepID=A0A9D4LQ66_DREPO|nr:uncharacterized protein LOC127866041 [Dreissena polymorpha]KAH3861747.1 hypothetical protein DPMN_024681 [Dreissena polymorpha]